MNLSGFFILLGIVSVATVSRWVAAAIAVAALAFCIWTKRNRNDPP